ncbi:MAG: cytochrome c maturation protein CcmE [Acidimicrobiales bacterium]
MTDDIDLTPRAGGGATTERKSLRNIGIVGTLVVVLGFVLFKAVTSASVYYYNVDEALDRQAELADRTFRLQGTVVTEPQTDASGAILFDVAFNDERVSVRHVGEEPTDLFELSIPVVAEGHFEGDVFVSRQLLIKHSESYVADNPDRIDPEIESKIDDADTSNLDAG